MRPLLPFPHLSLHGGGRALEARGGRFLFPSLPPSAASSQIWSRGDVFCFTDERGKGRRRQRAPEEGAEPARVGVEGDEREPREGKGRCGWAGEALLGAVRRGGRNSLWEKLTGMCGRGGLPKGSGEGSGS